MSVTHVKPFAGSRCLSMSSIRVTQATVVEGVSAGKIVAILGPKRLGPKQARILVDAGG